MSSVLFWHNLDLQPIAFQIGAWPVYSYGLILALAFLAGYLLAERRARHLCHSERNAVESRNLSYNEFLKMFWVVFLSGAVGARVWDWFFYENFWAQPWYEIFNIHGGGLAIHGFLLGGFLGLIIWVLLSSRAQPRDPSTLPRQAGSVGMTDQNVDNFPRSRNFINTTIQHSAFRIQIFLLTLIPAFLLAQAIGRWGNFFNQELYGAPTTLPWGIFIATANRLPGFENFQYFQPVFLYESLWLFLGLGLFLWLERKLSSRAQGLLSVPQPRDPSTLPRQAGSVGMTARCLLSFFLFWIFCGRALMELIRLDPAPLWFGLRAPLVYSTIIAIVALISLIVSSRAKRSEVEGSLHSGRDDKISKSYQLQAKS